MATKDYSISIRMTYQLRDDLQKLADEDDRKLSTFITHILSRYVAYAKAQRQGSPAGSHLPARPW